jgi:hypothetical protein
LNFYWFGYLGCLFHVGFLLMGCRCMLLHRIQMFMLYRRFLLQCLKRYYNFCYF